MPGKRAFLRQLLPWVIGAAVSASHAEERPHINLVSFVDSPYVLPVEHRPEGLVVDYVEALLKRAGFDFSMQILPPKRALLHALKQDNTCVFPIERSQEREVEFQWVSPVLISRHGFFPHPEKDIGELRVLADVQDYRLGSYLGSGIGEYLSALGFDVDYAATNEANIQKLLADRVGLWASDEVSALYIASRYGVELRPSPLIFFTTVRAMGCYAEMNPKYVQTLNKVLSDMHRDGSFDILKAAFAERLKLSFPR